MKAIRGDRRSAEYSTAPATDSGTSYLVADHLGSTRLVMDSGGGTKKCYDYVPFGGEIPSIVGGRPSCYGGAAYPSTPDVVSEKFTSKERDAETGLDYFGLRYLSSAQGRWTSPDAPFADQHLEDPQSWNMYTYVRNNSLRNTDPDGRQSCAMTPSVCQSIVHTPSGPPTARDVALAVAIAGGPAAAAFGGEALALGRALWTGVVGWALGHPAQVQEAAGTLGETLSNAPPGSLTSSFARLGTTTTESVERKLSQYLLNTEHEVGGPKAQWFNQALGFTKENLGDLAKQIVFDPKAAVQTGVTEYGTKYNQVINVAGANGKTIAVTFAWIRNNDGVVRLVTAVPAMK